MAAGTAGVIYNEGRKGQAAGPNATAPKSPPPAAPVTPQSLQGAQINDDYVMTPSGPRPLNAKERKDREEIARMLAADGVEVAAQKKRPSSLTIKP